MDASAPLVYRGQALGAYGYAEKPWFLPDVRLAAFEAECAARGLDARVRWLEAPAAADDDLALFHPPAHIAWIRQRCAEDQGALDHGATLARRGIEVAARHVVGAVVDATRRLLAGEARRAFVPIAGFHHALPDACRSYCLYNDPAIALALLRRALPLPVAYVDTDVHCGDGVYAGFAADPELFLVDLHEDHRTLWPHSPEVPGDGPVAGEVTWIGEGRARGTKLNLPLPAGATDADFLAAWARARDFIDVARPAFIVFVCGADALAGDPLAHLRLTPAAIARVTADLVDLAERHASGRLLVLGGGGYHLDNVRAGWPAALAALVDPAGAQR